MTICPSLLNLVRIFFKSDAKIQKTETRLNKDLKKVPEMCISCNLAVYTLFMVSVIFSPLSCLDTGKLKRFHTSDLKLTGASATLPSLSLAQHSPLAPPLDLYKYKEMMGTTGPVVTVFYP